MLMEHDVQFLSSGQGVTLKTGESYVTLFICLSCPLYALSGQNKLQPESGRDGNLEKLMLGAMG